MLVLGIDPGATGALALYDSEAKALLYIHDIPSAKIGGRSSLNEEDLANEIRYAVLLGAGVAVLEKIHSMPEQGVASMFSFGQTYGAIRMALVMSGIRIETVTPQTWKACMRVPTKKKDNGAAVGARADELFPAHRQLWRGPRKGIKHDRAEAAILALYGAQRFTKGR